MKRFTIIVMLGILFLPLITSVKVADAVVGGPYTDKISAELGSSSKSSGKGFSPDEIIVSVGTTVTWTNKDTVGHTVTSGSPNDPDAGKLFDSGSRWAPGEEFEHTFDTVGEFPYFCMIHPWTTGKVVVAEVVIQEDGMEDETPEDDISEEEPSEDNGSLVRSFLVEDIDGDDMYIRVSPSTPEAQDALIEMAKTGERRWVGGELVESSDKKFGFIFEPHSIVVAEITAEGLQAAKYKTLQEDFDYWKGLGTVYISGKVINIREKVTVTHQETSFNLTTSLSNGSVKSIEVNPGSTSLTLTLDTSTTTAGNLTIALPRELIDAKNKNEDAKFIVNAGNDKISYKERGSTAEERTLKMSIPAGTTKVEIIGTQVVPEFPLGLAVVLAGLVSVIVVITRLNVTNKILNV
ncbi:MAG: plastocyanin [Candidatus Nitrosomirales archaeon]|jgi:plastocyanin